MPRKRRSVATSSSPLELKVLSLSIIAFIFRISIAWAVLRVLSRLVQSRYIKTHATDVTSTIFVPHSVIGRITIQRVLFSITLEQLWLREEVIVCIVFLFLILEVARVIPSWRWVCHSWGNSNEIIALSLLVALRESSFATEAKDIAARLPSNAILVILCTILAVEVLIDLTRLAGLLFRVWSSNVWIGTTVLFLIT